MYVLLRLFDEIFTTAFTAHLEKFERRALPFHYDAIDEARLRGLCEAVVNFARRKTNYAVIFGERFHSRRRVNQIADDAVVEKLGGANIRDQ